jgi:hypothetical protein
VKDWISLHLAVFVVATFAASLVAGLSGFAFGIVAAALWLYVLTPAQTATLIVAFGLIVQAYSVWRLRHALNIWKLWPFVVGAAVGVPVGVSVLARADPGQVRTGIGVLLVAYCLYAMTRPAIGPVRIGGVAADSAVGFLSGILAGITGLAGILVTIWCGLRGWSKDEQRTVFQPVAVAIFVMAAVWLGASGVVTTETVQLFAAGLPAVLAGTWLGLRLYGHLNEAAFRTVVLGLVLISGVALIF